MKTAKLYLKNRNLKGFVILWDQIITQVIYGNYESLIKKEE